MADVPGAVARDAAGCCCLRGRAGAGVSNRLRGFIVKNRQKMVVSGFTRKNGGFASKTMVEPAGIVV